MAYNLITNDVRKTEPASGSSLPQWQAPVLRVFEISCTAGDPTIHDDGLGDGLFS